MRYLLDTNVISELTKRQPNQSVLDQWDLNGVFSCTSATVWLELWYGIRLMPEGKRQQELFAAMELLQANEFNVLSFCRDAAEWLAQENVRLRSQGIAVHRSDSEIAAVAAVHNLTLVTRNVDDFCMFSDIRIENWFE